MYVPEFFRAEELVPPAVHRARGRRSLQLLDPRLLEALDQLRNEFGPITINNWHVGGTFTESGLRTPECKHYKPYSQHTFGRAADCKFALHEPEYIRRMILDNPHKYPFINFVELDTPTWVHIDVRNCRRIATWSPIKRVK